MDMKTRPEHISVSEQDAPRVSGTWPQPMNPSDPQAMLKDVGMPLGFLAPFSREEIQANHACLLERNAVHRRFGFDPEASVRFVLEKALRCGGGCWTSAQARGVSWLRWRDTRQL